MKKRCWLRRVPLVVALIVCGISFLAALQFGASTSEGKYSEDPKGLETQFEHLAKAWSKHNAKAVDEGSTTFALPDPAGWFGKYFAKEQVQQLVSDDEAEIDNFKTVTPAMLNILAKGHKFQVKISPPSSSSPTKIQPRADAIAAVTPVSVEQFTVALIAEKGMSFSSVMNFVCGDGAFRYVGKGAYPFWSMPDAARK
jgi:hypothetical protein